MNRLFKYFSVFGILLVFAAYFFRLFEVNGYVKAVNAISDPDIYFLTLGKIYKIDYFFIALIMVSCLVSFILINRDNKKIPLHSISLIPISMAIIEKIYITLSVSVIGSVLEGNQISTINIVNVVILGIALLGVIASVLVKKYLDNKLVLLILSLSIIALVISSSLINIYVAFLLKASVHFISYSVFYLLGCALFILEFISRYLDRPLENIETK